MDKIHGAGERGDDVAHGFRRDDGANPVFRETGENVDQRNEQHALAEEGEEQGELAVAQSVVAVLAHDGHAQEKAAADIQPEHGRGLFDKRLIRREQAHEKTRKRHQQACADQRIQQRSLTGQPYGFLHAAVVARSVVEADYGLRPLIDADHRQQDKLEYRSQNGHGAHRDIPAETRELSVEAEQKNPLGGNHERRGRAENHDAPHKIPARRQEARPHAEQRQRSAVETHHPEKGNELGDDRGNGRSPDAHVQRENENRVENDVDHPADQGRHHADSGKALRIDEIVQAQTGLKEKGAEAVNAQIILGIGKRRLACAEQQKQRFAENLNPGRDQK